MEILPSGVGCPATKLSPRGDSGSSWGVKGKGAGTAGWQRDLKIRHSMREGKDERQSGREGDGGDAAGWAYLSLAAPAKPGEQVRTSQLGFWAAAQSSYLALRRACAFWVCHALPPARLRTSTFDNTSLRPTCDSQAGSQNSQPSSKTQGKLCVKF